MKYGNYSVGYPSTQVAGRSLFSQPSVEMYVGGQVKDLRRLLFELVCVISEFGNERKECDDHQKKDHANCDDAHVAGRLAPSGGLMNEIMSYTDKEDDKQQRTCSDGTVQGLSVPPKRGTLEGSGVKLRRHQGQELSSSQNRRNLPNSNSTPSTWRLDVGKVSKLTVLL